MSNPKWPLHKRGWFVAGAAVVLWLLIFCLWAAVQ